MSIQAFNRLKATAKTLELALMDSKAAVDYVNGMLQKNDLAHVAKAKAGKGGTTIEIRGKLFKPNDVWIDLYLSDDDKGKKTVELYMGDLPQVMFDGSYFAPETDLKKASAAKHIATVLEKGAFAAEAAGRQLKVYNNFLLNLSGFVTELARNIER